MYERFYQLRERPFALSPDPEYLYPSRIHREALDYLRFGIEGHAGFVVVTGEIGSGKTMLLQVLLRNLDGQTTVVRLANTLLNAHELLEAILIDLGVKNVPSTKPAMLRDLARILIQQRELGRRVLAVIDEAQNLSLEALEEIRMLSNLETEKSKLIQIVLVGQPDLRDKLASPTLEQLRQRVTVRYHISRLDADETAQYINHRLKRAALAAPLRFDRAVTDRVHARSGGVPRLINVICDAILLFGYQEERRIIEPSLLDAVFQELEAADVIRPENSAPAASSPAPAAEPMSAPAPAIHEPVLQPMIVDPSIAVVAPPVVNADPASVQVATQVGRVDQPVVQIASPALVDVPIVPAATPLIELDRPAVSVEPLPVTATAGPLKAVTPLPTLPRKSDTLAPERVQRGRDQFREREMRWEERRRIFQLSESTIQPPGRDGSFVPDTGWDLPLRPLSVFQSPESDPLIARPPAGRSDIPTRPLGLFKPHKPDLSVRSTFWARMKRFLSPPQPALED